jgi:hypothetical protein
MVRIEGFATVTDVGQGMRWTRQGGSSKSEVGSNPEFFLRLEPNCLAHARNDDLASIAQKLRHVLRQASVRSRVARRL